jgi:hypothetical protein
LRLTFWLAERQMPRAAEAALATEQYVVEIIHNTTSPDFRSYLTNT